MLSDIKTISVLQKLGLTIYGAKAYAALVSIGPTSATLISREAEIPRTKIYGVLKRLEEEKWISVEKGRPSIYSPKYPKEIIEDRKDVLYSEIDDVSNQLTMTYDHLMEKENPKVWLIRGIDNIISKTIEMMDRARQRIMLYGTLYSPKEIEPIRKQIIKAKERGISVRIITRAVIETNEGEIDVVRSFLPVTADIAIAGPPCLKFVLIDNRETLIVFSRVDGKISDLNNVVAIWVSNSSVASYVASNFNMTWNASNSIDQSNEK